MRVYSLWKHALKTPNGPSAYLQEPMASVIRAPGSSLMSGNDLRLLPKARRWGMVLSHL